MDKNAQRFIGIFIVRSLNAHHYSKFTVSLH